MSEVKYAFVGAAFGGVVGLVASLTLMGCADAEVMVALNCVIGGLMFGFIVGRATGARYVYDGEIIDNTYYLHSNSDYFSAYFGVLLGLIAIMYTIIGAILGYTDNLIFGILFGVSFGVVGAIVGAVVGTIINPLTVGELVESCTVSGVVLGGVFAVFDIGAGTPLYNTPLFIPPVFAVIGCIGGGFLDIIICRMTVKKRRREEEERQLEVKRREQARKEQMHREGMKQEILNMIEEVSKEEQ